MHMDISQGNFCASRQTKPGGRNANPEPPRLGKNCCASEKTCSPTLNAYHGKYAGKVWVIIQVSTVWRKELGCTSYPLLNNRDNGKSPCRLMIFPFKPSICRGFPSQAWLITGGYPKLNRNWKPHIRWINKQKTTYEQSRKLRVHEKDINKFWKVPSLTTHLYKTDVYTAKWEGHSMT